MKEKLYIKNRNNKKISVIIETPEANSDGIAFIMHGLGGRKEQDHIETFAKAFLDSGYGSIRFDTRNTFGESEGNYEDATLTDYYNDLVDVIDWAKTQKYYKEPFFLVGHSLGGICVSLFAENHPGEVKGLAPISTVVSGKLFMDLISKEKLENYNSSGWRITESKTTPGFMKKLKWKPYNEDILKYDLLKNVNKLTMPVLMIVGDKDESTPLLEQNALFSKIPGKKELHIIKDAPHTFIDKKHLEEIRIIIKKWIKTI